METIFIVYKTDVHHSYASRDIIGVASTAETAVEICLEQAGKEGEEISEAELWNLENLRQTQGYAGEGEFQFEAVAIDVLL